MPTLVVTAALLMAGAVGLLVVLWVHCARSGQPWGLFRTARAGALAVSGSLAASVVVSAIVSFLAAIAVAISAFIAFIASCGTIHGT